MALPIDLSAHDHRTGHLESCQAQTSQRAWQHNDFISFPTSNPEHITVSARIAPKMARTLHRRFHAFVTGMSSLGYPLTQPKPKLEKYDMKYLLSSLTIVAAVAMAAPASAQRTGPGPYAETGTGPGVNPPGGPGPSSPLFNLPAGSAALPGAATPAPSSTTWAPPPPPNATSPAIGPQSR